MDNGNREKRPPVKRHYRPKGFIEKSSEHEAAVETEGVIEGRNAVIEAFRAGLNVDKVYIAKGDVDSTLRHIAGTARKSGAVVVEADRRKLDSMSATGAHQGVIALSCVREYVSIEDILELARQKQEAPFIVICDEITDSHNLGAIIRTAEAVGAHGMIIPKRRSVGITAVVQKTSAGAASHLAVARVPNITAAIEKLKKEGVWIFGAAAQGNAVLWDTELTGAIAIVIGSEGEGMTRLVSEHCDFKVRIPMLGKMSSLNASVSAAVFMYEALRQRSAAHGR